MFAYESDRKAAAPGEAVGGVASASPKLLELQIARLGVSSMT